MATGKKALDIFQPTTGKGADIGIEVPPRVKGHPAAMGATFYTGNNLVELMPAYETAVAAGPLPVKGIQWDDARSYVAYIAGVYDSLAGALWERHNGITQGQASAIVAKYLKNHPERWSEPAMRLVVDALVEAFPLPKKK